MSATRTATRTSVKSAALNPLKVFVWEGKDKRGTTMKGEQVAKNANLLRAALRAMGIVPKVVKPKPKPLFGSAAHTISPRDIAIFARQLATMMKSGVPIVTS